jgi:hypothetical protein
MVVLGVCAPGLDAPQSVLMMRKRRRLSPSSPRLQDAASGTIPLDSDWEDGSDKSTACEVEYNDEDFDELPPAKRRKLSESEAAPLKPKISSTAQARKYKCNYTECNKSYTKPARLREHERSHTGEASTKARSRVDSLVLNHSYRVTASLQMLPSRMQ